jgi:hypothetical protein
MELNVKQTGIGGYGIGEDSRFDETSRLVKIAGIKGLSGIHGPFHGISRILWRNHFKYNEFFPDKIQLRRGFYFVEAPQLITFLRHEHSIDRRFTFDLHGRRAVP